MYDPPRSDVEVKAFNAMNWFADVTTEWTCWDFGIGFQKISPGWEVRLLAGSWLLSAGRSA